MPVPTCPDYLYNCFIVYQEKELSLVILMEPLSDSFLMTRVQAYPK